MSIFPPKKIFVWVQAAIKEKAAEKETKKTTKKSK